MSTNKKVIISEDNYICEWLETIDEYSKYINEYEYKFQTKLWAVVIIQKMWKKHKGKFRWNRIKILNKKELINSVGVINIDSDPNFNLINILLPASSLPVDSLSSIAVGPSKKSLLDILIISKAHLLFKQTFSYIL